MPEILRLQQVPSMLQQVPRMLQQVPSMLQQVPQQVAILEISGPGCRCRRTKFHNLTAWLMSISLGN
jgi:hypothetical protein